MKIQSILSNKFQNVNKQRENKSNHNATPVVNTYYEKRAFAYRDYSVNFTERLNRTPENFYAQEFNRNNMPVTVKDYLFENFDERHHMPPAQLQREAYQYLALADNVNEVKDLYNNEPLFKDLKSIDDTKPSKGILLLLKWDKQTSNTPIFKDKSNNDLTVYLLKKVYLEGKTLDEINKDFDKDTTEEIKRELGVKDGKYFAQSTLRSLGIRYPNLSYYNSFLATRNDKEYVPPVRKPSTHTVSDETRQKLSEASKSWWAGLNEIERTEQIKKMMEGRDYADTIIDKFRGPIMTLAAGQMNFSEKLSQIFAEKLSDEAFMDEFPQFEERQSEIMLEFWNKDPEFRKNYSITLKSIIADFDFAYSVKNASPEYLEDLLAQALEQKNSVIENAKLKRRERSVIQNTKQEQPQIEPKPELPPEPEIKVTKELSTNEIYKNFRNNMLSHLDIYSKAYKEKMFDFAMKNTNREFKKQFITEAGSKEVDEKMSELHSNFEKQNPTLARANRIALAGIIFDETKDETIFLADNYELSKKLPAQYKTTLKLKRNQIDKSVNSLLKPTPQDDIEDYFENTLKHVMYKKFKSGFNYVQTDKTLHTGDVTPNIGYWVAELQKHNAELKFIRNEKNNEKARDVVSERLIVELLDWMSEFVDKQQIKQLNPKTYQYKNPQIMIAINNVISKNKFLYIDMNSITSLKIAYGKYLNDKYLQYCNDEYRTQLIDFSISYPKLDREMIIFCLAAGTGILEKDEKIKEYTRNMTEAQKAEYKLIERKTFEALTNAFKKENPLIANAAEFALKQTYSEITNSDEFYSHGLSYLYRHIIENENEQKLIAAKDLIQKRTEEYAKELTFDEIQDFYSNYFVETFDKISSLSFKKKQADLTSFDNAAIDMRYKLSEDSTKDLMSLVVFLKTNRGAIEYITNPQNPTKTKNILKNELVTDFLKTSIDFNIT